MAQMDKRREHSMALKIMTVPLWPLKVETYLFDIFLIFYPLFGTSVSSVIYLV